MVRLMGEVPVLPGDPAAGEQQAEWESWARHILTLAPQPGSALATKQPAWGALAQYLAERRHREQEQVAAGFADLRRALLNIAEAMRGTLAREQPDSQLGTVKLRRAEWISSGTATGWPTPAELLLVLDQATGGRPTTSRHVRRCTARSCRRPLVGVR